MAAPLARTRDEALLYMELRPCDNCGATYANWNNALTSDDGEPARRYYAECPECGVQREFVFRLPDRPLIPPPGSVAMFGGGEPSELLDAGEWLWLADLCAKAAVPNGTDPAGHPQFDAESQDSLAIAAAAMDEVLKFIPADAGEVPRSGFWSERGREMRDKEPGRFRRGRLVVVRDTYREALPSNAG